MRPEIQTPGSFGSSFTPPSIAFDIGGVNVSFYRQSSVMRISAYNNSQSNREHSFVPTAFLVHPFSTTYTQFAHFAYACVLPSTCRSNMGHPMSIEFDLLYITAMMMIRMPIDQQRYVFIRGKEGVVW